MNKEVKVISLVNGTQLIGTITQTENTVICENNFQLAYFADENGGADLQMIPYEPHTDGFKRVEFKNEHVLTVLNPTQDPNRNLLEVYQKHPLITKIIQPKSSLILP